MSFVEIIFIKLGPAIVKSIAAYWLKSEDFASDATGDILSLIQNKTGDIATQKRAEVHFNGMINEIADSLVELFEVEVLNARDLNREAVVLALVDTVESAHINATLLAQQNFDPTSLTKYLLPISKMFTVDFSRAESDLFARALGECSYYLIHTATNLPNYSQNTFAEVFRRQDQILEASKRTLEELKVMRKESLKENLEQNYAFFEHAYRQNVLTKLGKMELFGIKKSATGQRYGLESAFVSLQVEQIRTRKYPKRNQEEQTYPENRARVDSHMGFLSITQMLSRSSRLFVRGEAGSGKTTLLQWISVRASTNSFPSEIKEWNGNIPFLIKLREYVGVDFPTPQDFIKTVAPLIVNEAPNTWVASLMRSGRAVILIDGVDELPVEQIQPLRVWLQDLLNNFPDARYIITSRQYAVPEDWLFDDVFQIFDLQRMDLFAVLDFIDRWHQAVSENLFEENETKELQERNLAMKDLIRQDRSIQRLSTNPLLCAMLCALSRERRDDLPSRRSVLYESSSRILLETRDRQRKIKVDNPPLDYEELSKILERVAYWMLDNGYKEISKKDATKQISLALNSLNKNNDTLQPATLYNYLVKRSGIVREPEPEFLDFVHTTFQEFFAAKSINYNSNIRSLVNRAYDRKWKEVVVLTSELVNKVEQIELIEGLIEQGDRGGDGNGWFYVLAMACVGSAVSIDRRLKATVQQRLNHVRLPKTQDEAESWSAAGSLAISRLSNNFSFDSSVRSNCIRALAVIGGEQSLQAISDYVTHDNDKYFELDHAVKYGWQYFDREIYLQRVIDHCPSFEVSDDSELSFVSQMGSLRYLTISNITQIQDFYPISEIKGLQNLTLWSCSNLNDLDWVSKLENLTSFQICDCPMIKNLKPISKLKNIREFKFFGFSEIEDIDFISEMISLNHLFLWDLPKVLSIDALKSLSNLEWLDIGPLSGVKNLSVLGELKNLRKLSIFNVSFDSEDFLKELIHLQRLSLTINPETFHEAIPSINLDFLENAGDLEILEISQPVISLNALKNKNKLHRLSINCQKITSLDPLRNLNNLKKLYLYNCHQIFDVYPIAQLENLEAFHINGLAEHVDVSTLQKIPDCKIEWV